MAQPPLGQRKKNGKISFALGGGQTTPVAYGGGLATSKGKTEKTKFGGLVRPPPMAKTDLYYYYFFVNHYIFLILLFFNF